MRLVHNHQHPLFDGVMEERHVADVVRLVPLVEEGVSLGSGGCNGASGS
jgi:hypothetical protein